MQVQNNTSDNPTAANAEEVKSLRHRSDNQHTLPMFLTVPEVAELLRTTPKAVYTMIERGQLVGVVRVNRKRILIRRDDLLHSLDYNRTPSPQERKRW